jgi:hypothetical protein
MQGLSVSGVEDGWGKKKMETPHEKVWFHIIQVYTFVLSCNYPH